MSLQLRIAGPGLDVTRTLQPGDPALILGRDADCSVCLPDPQRNVSRRHLSVWSEGDALHFHVLSVVNGVELPSGDVAPGARGVLAPGLTLRLAEYSVTVAAPALGEPLPPPQQPQPASEPEDPWAVFDRDASGVVPVPPELQTLQAGGGNRPAVDEDPFGDWGFETTFGPGGPGGAALEADALGAAKDLAPFLRGLGLDAARVGALSVGEMETLGRVVRHLALGVVQLHAQAHRAKQDLNAEDRTMLGVRGGGINPLKSDAEEGDKLRYLFGGRAASAGFLGPERAVAEVLGELLAHEKATGPAVRATVEGVLREFDPEALKARLLAGGPKLFESARAWDAFCKHYEQRRQQLPQWAQQLLDRYFAEAYLRETQRLKRETPQRR